MKNRLLPTYLYFVIIGILDLKRVCDLIEKLIQYNLCNSNTINQFIKVTFM